MSDSMMDRNLDPVSPINPLLSNEVFRVKPVSKDSDRKQDERFEEQLKKKKQDEETTDTFQTGQGADLDELDADTSIVLDEVTLSGTAGKTNDHPASAVTSDGAERKDTHADKDGHVHVIA